MEIFGFSCLKVTRTGAGSLKIEQRFSVPLEKAHRASGAYYVVPEVNWGNAVRQPLWGVKQSHAAIREFMEHLTERSPVELMQLSQNLGHQSDLARVKNKLGLSEADTNIPYQADSPYRERWQEILWHLLREKQDIYRQIERFNGVARLETVEKWLKHQTVKTEPNLHMPIIQEHSLDIYSPDLKNRVLLRCKPPFLALFISEDNPRPRLNRYPDRQSMLAAARRVLVSRGGTDMDMLSPHLKPFWRGQPLEAHMVRPWGKSKLRLSTSNISDTESQAKELRGYLRHAQSGEQAIDRSILPEVKSRILSSGLVHPGLQPVESRPEPNGKLVCLKPQSVWLVNQK